MRKFAWPPIPNTIFGNNLTVQSLIMTLLKWAKGVDKYALDSRDMDDKPTKGSTLPVTSNGIYEAIESIPGAVVDPDPTEGSEHAVSSGGVYTALQSKQNKLTFDSTPTLGSDNPVTSDGIKKALDTIEPPDITVDPHPTEGSSNPVSSGGVYEDLYGLQAQVDTNEQTVDQLQTETEILKENKQDKLTFDGEPTLGSQNPVTSDGIKKAIDNIDPPEFTVDPNPTEGSSNPVSSGGTYDAIQGLQTQVDASKKDIKAMRSQINVNEDNINALYNVTGDKQDKLTFDDTPTLGSQNPVTSDGIKKAIDAIPGGGGGELMPNPVITDHGGSNNKWIAGGSNCGVYVIDGPPASVTVNGYTFSDAVGVNIPDDCIVTSIDLYVYAQDYLGGGEYMDFYLTLHAIPFVQTGDVIIGDFAEWVTERKPRDRLEVDMALQYSMILSGRKFAQVGPPTKYSGNGVPGAAKFNAIPSVRATFNIVKQS